MKFICSIFFAFMAMFFVAAPVNAQETVGHRLTTQVLTYGDWYGATDQPIPTVIANYFYSPDGRLVAVFSGRYQLMDSPDTPEVEKEGDIKPVAFTSYDYTADGQLLCVRERSYKAVNGFYSGWAEETVKESYAYDDHGKKVSGRKDSHHYTYVWDGDLLVEETDSTDNGTWISTKRYSDFLEGADNCPQSALQTGTYQNYILEYTYDEDFRLVKLDTYQVSNVQKDNSGHIMAAEKGDLYMEETWQYTETGALSGYLKSYWNNGLSALVPDNKDVYEWSTAADEPVQRYRVSNYRYNGSTGAWTLFGSPKEYVEAPHDSTLVVSNLNVTPFEDRSNAVSITFRLPGETPEGTVWNVYRNGVCIGQAGKLSGMMTFNDKEVPNGKWTYFVKPEGEGINGESYISNPVEQVFDTPLPPVTDIQCLENGRILVDGTTQYAYRLAWNAPETALGIKGYNVIVNPKSYDSNPPAHNAQLLTTPNYLLTMSDYDQLDHRIMVEVVYNIGYIKSDTVVFTLDPSRQMETRETAVRAKTVYTYGDVMGGLGYAQPSRQQTWYYDASGKVTCCFTGGYLLGDDPDTPELEEAGTLVPMAYSIYHYDENQRLTDVQQREYGVYSGYDKAWSDQLNVVESYEYTADGHLSAKTLSGSQRHEYEWEGDKLVRETRISVGGDEEGPLWTMTYSDFVDGFENLPQSALKVSDNANTVTNDRVYEMRYDEAGNLTERIEYLFGENVVKDNTGRVIQADKGQPYAGETWTYENGVLRRYEKSQWKASAGALVPSARRDYTPTARGMREETYSYTNLSGTAIWTRSAVYTETVNATYFTGTQPRGLQVETVEGQPNTVRLTCSLPETSFPGTSVFEVYRNGFCIGQATVENGEVVYVDREVENGHWDYFVKVIDPTEGIGYPATEIVEHAFHTPLPPVTHISFPVNGKDAATAQYVLTVAWEAPETDWTIKGYNIYTDIKEITKNPAPDNGVIMLPADQLTYTYAWYSLMDMHKTVSVETVYNIGKVKSELVPVTILDTPAAVDAPRLMDRFPMEVYTLGGQYVGRYANAAAVRTLPSGIYVVKQVTDSGVIVRKQINL